jgi:hypothetical protein
MVFMALVVFVLVMPQTPTAIMSVVVTTMLAAFRHHHNGGRTLWTRSNRRTRGSANGRTQHGTAIDGLRCHGRKGQQSGQTKVSIGFHNPSKWKQVSHF